MNRQQPKAAGTSPSGSRLQRRIQTEEVLKTLPLFMLTMNGSDMSKTRGLKTSNNPVTIGRTSKTFIRALKEQEPCKVFQSNTRPLWRRDSNLGGRRNGKSFKTTEPTAAAAWVSGIVTIRFNKKTQIPSKYLLQVKGEIKHNVYVMKHIPNNSESRKLVSFLHDNRAEICNIFGSLSDSCKRGDSLLRSIMDQREVTSLQQKRLE
jgi:hypothetical protein